MDDFMKNRFKYLNELNDEQLLFEKEGVKNEIQNLLSTLEDKNISHYEKSEIKNSDLPYEKDKLLYIEYLIEERNLENKKL